MLGKEYRHYLWLRMLSNEDGIAHHRAAPRESEQGALCTRSGGGTGSIAGGDEDE